MDFQLSLAKTPLLFSHLPSNDLDAILTLCTILSAGAACGVVRCERGNDLIPNFLLMSDPLDPRSADETEGKEEPV